MNSQRPAISKSGAFRKKTVPDRSIVKIYLKVARETMNLWGLQRPPTDRRGPGPVVWIEKKIAKHERGSLGGDWIYMPRKLAEEKELLPEDFDARGLPHHQPVDDVPKTGYLL